MLMRINRLLLSARKRGDEGASAVEYALILAFISGLLVIMFVTIGSNARGRLQTACDQLQAQPVGSGTCP